MNAWKWPDARGWIGIGTFFLTCTVIALLACLPELRSDEFFKTIATLIVGAFIKDVVGWAYSATQSGSKLAEANSRMIENSLSTGDPTGETS